MDRSWFAIMLASITAALLVFSENSVAQPTPPCSGCSTRLEPNGAVVVLASYRASESTPLVKSSMSTHSAVPSSSHSVGSSLVQSGLRNGIHLLIPSVTASVRAKSSAKISPASINGKARSTSVRAMTTPTNVPVTPSSGTSPANSTIFTGAGTQSLVMSTMVGGVVLLSFLWFFWN